MRRTLCVLMLLLPLMVLPCLGAEVAFPQADQVLQAAEQYGVSETEDLSRGIQGILNTGLDQLGVILRRSLQTGVKLLAVVLLCGLAEQAALEGGSGKSRAVELAGALAVTTLTVNDMTTMIGLGRETIHKMDVFADLLLPAVATLTAATGGVTGAAVRQGVTVLFSDLLISAIDQLLIPLLYAYVAACCAHAALGNEGLKRIADLIRGSIIFLLTTGLLIFVGYLTASGAIAGSADAAAVKAGVLFEVHLNRRSVGVVGMLVVLAICIVPFLQLAVHYLTYKGASALIETVAGSSISKLLERIGGAFGMILGMTGSCALILLFSLVSAISAVTAG